MTENQFSKKVKDLAGENLPHMGVWEIAQVPEPVSGLQTKSGSRPVLNLVVHKESYFIFNTHLALPEEANGATKTLVEAIEEYKVVPEVLAIREKKIIKELEPIARAFDFAIAYPVRLKAVPIVLREMRKFFQQR